MATGALASITYGIEDEFGIAPEEINNVFGRGVKITSWEENNNSELIYGIGRRLADALDVGRYEGTFTLEFNLSNHLFLQSVFGTPQTGLYSLNSLPKSISVKKGVPGETADVKVYKGCVCTECTISIDNERAAKVSITYIFGCAPEVVGGTVPSQIADTEPIYTFAEGTWSIGGSRLAAVQNFELSFTQNSELVWGVGNRFAIACEYKQLEVGISTINRYADPTAYYQKMYGGNVPQQTGPSEITDLQILFKSLKGGDDLQFDINSAYVESVSIPVRSEEMIAETVEIMCTDLTVKTIAGS